MCCLMAGGLIILLSETQRFKVAHISGKKKFKLGKQHIRVVLFKGTVLQKIISSVVGITQ